MNINVKIIEAVKQQPLLYEAKGTLKERQLAWKQLAEELKMQEQFLRSRWYMLLDGFKRAKHSQKGPQQQQQQQQSIKFKYKHEMEFLCPYLQRSQSKKIAKIEEYLPEHIVRPEFVITEKDLENYGQNDEEYVFLEVEPLEVSGAEDTDHDNREVQPNKPQEETSAEVKQEHRREQQQTSKCDAVVDRRNYQNALINDSAEETKQQKATANNDKEIIHIKNEVETTTDMQEQKENATKEATASAEDTNCSAKAADKNDTNCSVKAAENIEKESECSKTTTKDVDSTEDHSNQSTATKNVSAKGNSVGAENSNSSANNNATTVDNSCNKDNCDTNNSNSATNTTSATTNNNNNNNDRSEDDIFGELVAAMLKRMPAEKKRLVKKDIMNLLLT